MVPKVIFPEMSRAVLIAVPVKPMTYDSPLLETVTNCVDVPGAVGEKWTVII
jgi:hypothetical protein